MEPAARVACFYAHAACRHLLDAKALPKRRLRGRGARPRRSLSADITDHPRPCQVTAQRRRAAQPRPSRCPGVPGAGARPTVGTWAANALLADRFSTPKLSSSVTHHPATWTDPSAPIAGRSGGEQRPREASAHRHRDAYSDRKHKHHDQAPRSSVAWSHAVIPRSGAGYGTARALHVS